MDWKFIIFSLVKIAIVVGVVQGLVAYSVLAERKISAWIQDRVGPNRCAPPFAKYIPILGPMLKASFAFPIDRTKNDRAALRTAMDRLKAGHVVGIYPEGGIRHGPHAVLNGAELPVGTASLWKMMDLPVIPMIVICSDQMYALKYYLRRPRIFLRVGPLLPAPEEGATRETSENRSGFSSGSGSIRQQPVMTSCVRPPSAAR